MAARTPPGRARALTPMLCVLAAALAGCGGSSSGSLAAKSPTEILAAGKAAAEGASSVHVARQVGQGSGSNSASVDLTGSHGGRGRLNLGRLTFEAILIANTLYVKGNAAFDAQLGGRHAPLASTTWLKASAAGGPLSGIAPAISLERLLSPLLGAGGAAKGATTTVDGQQAVEVKTGSFSVFIATGGKHYPIKITKNGAGLADMTTFSNWNAPVSLSPPPNAIDVSRVLSTGH
jgi:hypothetical protein